MYAISSLIKILKPVGLFIQSYDIIITSVDSGILEFCNDTISMDQLKKCLPGQTLQQIYRNLFGDNYEEAQLNFILSLAAYSLL
jgi:phosphatidylinositol 4-kinase